VRWQGAAVLLGAVLLWAGCEGDGFPGPGGGEEVSHPSFTLDVQPILEFHCTGYSCHAGSTPAGDLLLAGDSYDQLVDQYASSGGVRVVPFSSSASVLIQMLEGTRTPRMPFLQDPLPDGTLATLRNWIDDGASDN
jgi:hypothetical protein